MECLSQVCSIVPCLWDCSAKHAAYVTDLEDNLNSLKTAMDELNNLNQDVKNRVAEAEEHNMKQTNRVNGWLQRVEAVEKEANQVLQKGTQELENKCVGSCPKNCWSSYKLGKKVLKMLPEVTTLIEKGQFDVIADKLSAPPVDEQPMENTVVGFESNFLEVWQCVEDQDLSIIGLVGIGGVGKTTLLKQLNNEFLKRKHGFDLVIWIVVSKPANLGRIRETIRGKLNIPDESWVNKSEYQRVSTIFNKLKEKKFVVLLDDLWDKLELSELGIPQPCAKNMSKVMFTTRSHEVCQCMDAHKSIKVGCLPLDQALKLFYSKVGEDMLKSHEEIRELVKDVARECQGLPLALITIGQSMRGKTSAQQWKDAKRALQKYPSTFPGMKGRVFSKLVFSYDCLPTPTHQKCFEYCSIFPEDHNIEQEDVIKLWLAERLIDEYDTMYDALIQGRQIIESLVQSGLLEIGEKEGTFNMHDVIRDMALWLACDRGEKKNEIWVDVVSDEVVPAVYIAKWRNAEKVSLWGPDTAVEFLSGLSFCSNLVTLIIRDTNLEVLPGEVFQSMKTLQVLDLSDNKKLIELPTEIGCLINLEYLNIIGTHVRRLPEGVAQLTKLRFLLLSYRTVTGKVLSSLCSLQTFEQNGKWDWSPHDEAEDKTRDREMLEQLEKLKHIMDLCLVITSAVSIQLLLDSPKLQSCTRQLTLKTDDSLPAVLDLSKRRLLEHVEMLHLVYCDMPGIKLSPSSLRNLRHVLLSCCNNILTLSSLVYIPNLCTLRVSCCMSIEELIGEGEEMNLDTSLFSSLTSLEFWLLPKLRSICPQKALPFPCLKLLKVGQCGSLHKLPLDSNTAKTIPPEFRIRGADWWWNQLQWDGEETKNAFTPKFCPDQCYNTDSDSDSDSNSDSDSDSELPAEIGGLVDLEYLNIKGTPVRRLPEEVKQLKKLKYLLVSKKTMVSRKFMLSLRSLPAFDNCTLKFMASLKSLQAFDNCAFYDVEYVDEAEAIMEGEMLQGLEELKHMMDLCIQICSAASVQILFNSQNLQRCTRHLKLACIRESLPEVLDFSIEDN